MKNEMILKTKRLLLTPKPMEKPKTSWMTVYMCFGISIGMALGSLMGNISIGMCYGVSAAGLRYGCLREEAPGGDPGRGEKVTWLGMTKRSFTISTPWG